MEPTEDRRNTFENNSDVLITYNKDLGSKLFISALGGANIRTFKYNSSWLTTDYLVVPGVYNFSNSLYPIRGYNYRAQMMVYSGYAGVDLSYDKYLTLSATGRIDKLSTLPKNNNTFFYPSLTLSTMVSDYVKLPVWFSALKARASYANVKGALTRSSIGTAYQALGFGDPWGSTLRSNLQTSYNGPTYSNQDSYITINHYNNVPAITLSSTLSNSSLKPYTVSSYEAGLEMGFVNNRFGIDFTYFRSINGPQIFAKTASPSSGFSQQLINGVKTQKVGYEIALRLVPIMGAGGFNWQVAINGSTYSETLKEAIEGEDGISINGHYYKVGERLDGIYGTKYNRTKDGQIIFDAGGMPLYSPKGDEHNRLLGYANPNFVWGITNTLSYKNFTFSFQIDGRIGGVMFNELASRQFQSGNSPLLVSGAYGEARLAEWNSFKNTGSITPGYVGEGVVIASGTPRFENGCIVNLDELTFAPNQKAVRIQSYTQSVYSNIMEEFIADKTYAKLRQVVIGYSFPVKFLGNRVKQLNASIIGRNLLYFSKVDNMDMDQYGEGFNAANNYLTFRPAEQRLQSPTTRQIGFNLNVTF